MIVITRTTASDTEVLTKADKRGISLRSYGNKPEERNWWITDDSNYDAIVKWFAEDAIITLYSTKKEEKDG